MYNKNAMIFLKSSIIKFAIKSSLLFLVIGTSVSAQSIEPAENCQQCHTKTFNDWKISTHSKKLVENPFFTILTKSIKSDSTCFDCHAPLLKIVEPYLSSKDAFESITCDVCHVSTLNGSKLEFEKNEEHVKFGPIDDPVSSVHESMFSKDFKTGKLCFSCHDNSNKPHGKYYSSPVKEWKKSSYKKKKINCQDCHMPSTEGKTAPLGKMRDHIHSHQFYGAHSPEFLKNAVTLDLSASWGGDNSFEINVNVNNQSVGHSFPTGSPFRIAYLKVSVYDSLGNVQWQNYVNSPISENSQSVFAKIITNSNSNQLALPWESNVIVKDQRLGVDESRELSFTINLAPQYFKIESILYFRLIAPEFINLITDNLDQVYHNAIIVSQQTMKIQPEL